MEKNPLQYIVLILGTIAFAILLYFIVQIETGKISNPLTETTTADFNQITSEQATIYSEPDNSSTIITTVPTDTKIKTTSETKYYFRIKKIDGQNNLSDGYISKRKLKRLQ